MADLGFKFAVGLAAALLAGCSSTNAPDAADDSHVGTLVIGGDPGTQCTALASPGDVTSGFEVATVTGSAPVTVLSLKLVGASHVALVGAYFTPVADNTLVGVAHGWPPAGSAGRAAVAEAHKLQNTKLKPDAAPPQVLLHLRTSTAEASFHSFAITYLDSLGNKQEATSSTRMVFKTSCSA